MPRRPRPLLARWAAVLALTAAATVACDVAGVPSPELFAGLLAGMAVALWLGWDLTPPKRVLSGAQGVLGVALGAYVQSDTVAAVGEHLLPVVAVCAATLALTVVAGIGLARVSDLDTPTASFGMIAGGASGIIAIADELGADNRLVAVLQYLRVLLILVLTPLVAATVFPGDHGGGLTAGGAADLATGEAALFLAVSLAGGPLLARLTRLPAAALLGPMLVAGGLTLAGAPFAGPLPGWLQSVAFAVIGLQVGLRFTMESLRAAGRALAPGLLAIGFLLVGCALLGLLLAPLAGVSTLDAYLATTPGGLYAVLATAVGSGANTTFVLSVQVLRLFVMLLAAPVLARWLARLREPAPA
ncbi:MAG: AbrB family transcriptional regulator [Solirubrobacterales bacterium]|nr:AbrB family transcriptional regulator [Solirubrobacterales bacterium]